LQPRLTVIKKEICFSSSSTACYNWDLPDFSSRAVIVC
jgi:hypothetical protein